jgi:hypothetical protein
MRAACSEAYRLREQYEAGIKKNNGGALRDVCFTYALLCMLTYAYACLRMLYLYFTTKQAERCGC